MAKKKKGSKGKTTKTSKAGSGIDKKLLKRAEKIMKSIHKLSQRWDDPNLTQSAFDCTLMLAQSDPSPIKDGSVKAWACAILSVALEYEHPVKVELSELCVLGKTEAAEVVDKVEVVQKALGLGLPESKNELRQEELEHLMQELVPKWMASFSIENPKAADFQAFLAGMLVGANVSEAVLAHVEAALKALIESQASIIRGQQPRRYNFLLNLDPRDRYTRCFHCRERTKRRVMNFVMAFTDWPMGVLKWNCRLCEDCEILIIHDDDLRRHMAETLDCQPDDFVSKYQVLGTLSPGLKIDFDNPPEGDVLEEHLSEFAGHVRVEVLDESPHEFEVDGRALD